MTNLVNVLPKTAEDVQQTVAENLAFRASTKLDKKRMCIPLVQSAVERIVFKGAKSETVMFGLTPLENVYVIQTVADYSEWQKDKAAYLAKIDTTEV